MEKGFDIALKINGQLNQIELDSRSIKFESKGLISTIHTAGTWGDTDTDNILLRISRDIKELDKHAISIHEALKKLQNLIEIEYIEACATEKSETRDNRYEYK